MRRIPPSAFKEFLLQTIQSRRSSAYHLLQGIRCQPAIRCSDRFSPHTQSTYSTASVAWSTKTGCPPSTRSGRVGYRALRRAMPLSLPSFLVVIPQGSAFPTHHQNSGWPTLSHRERVGYRALRRARKAANEDSYKKAPVGLAPKLENWQPTRARVFRG